MVMENMNDMPNCINGNEKLEKSKEIVDELEADILAATEHKGNLSHKDNRNGFRQMYQGGRLKSELRWLTMFMRMWQGPKRAAVV